MDGIVTLLEETYYSQVEAIWQDLEQACGLVGVKITPLPHFSWQIAAEYLQPDTRYVLAQVTRSMHPFSVRTTGLGLFTGPIPVIYIQVVKNAALIELHDRLWQATDRLGKERSTYYAPGVWVPHITLAHGDVDEQKLECAMRRLAFREYNWELNIDHLAFVFQGENQQGWLRYRFDFG